MKKTFVYDREQGKMVELERQPAPIYTGTKLDPQSVDAALPRALKQLGDMDEFRHMSKRQLANAMGFNSLETVKRTWNHLLCFAFLLATCVAGFCQNYITPGVIFQNGQQLTAGQLNAAIGNATIGYPFYTTQAGESTLNNGDQFLILTTGNQFRRISAVNAFLDNTNWYNAAPQNTNFTTNAFVLVWDGGATGQIFKVGLTNWPSLNSTLQIQTNWDPNASIAVYDPITGQSWTEIWNFISTNWINWFSFTNNPPSLTNAPGNINTISNVVDTDLVPWYNSTAKSNEVTSWKTLKYSVTNAAVVGDARNLQYASSEYLFGSPGPGLNSGTITADEIVLKSVAGTGASFLCKNLSQTLDDELFSAYPPWGGIDSLADNCASTWLYIYAISDGTNQGTILTTNSTGPWLTNGVLTNVQYSALVGSFYTRSDGSMPPFLQKGRQCYILPTNLLDANITTSYSAMWATNQGGAQTGIATNLAPNFNTMVPPIAKTVTGFAGAADPTEDCYLALSGGSANFGYGATNGIGETLIRGPHATSLYQGYSFSEPFTIPVQTTSSNVLIWWRSKTSTVTNAVTITGYGL